RALRWGFVAYLVVLASSLMLRGRVSTHDQTIEATRADNFFALLGVGIVAGAFSGLLGIGGGLAMVALLGIAMSVPQHEGQAISLAVSALPLALPAIAVYASDRGGVPWIDAVFVVGGLFVGTLIGARIATKLAGGSLRRYFIIL